MNEPSSISNFMRLSMPLLTVGLRTCAEELPRGGDRRSLSDLAAGLESGLSLPELLQQPRLAKNPLRPLIEAGLRTGKLPQLLEGVIDSIRSSHEIWRQFRRSLWVPGLMVCLLAGFLMLFFWMINPGLRSPLEEMGYQLPGLTLFLFSATDLFFHWLPRLVVGLIVTGVLSALLIRTVWFARFVNRLPWFGFARRTTAAAEFCSRLALLIEAEIPLPEALSIVGSSLRDAELRDVGQRLSQRVATGESFSVAAGKCPDLLPAVAMALQRGEDRQGLVKGLQLAGDLCALQASVRIEQLAVVIEPAVTVGVAGIAGFVVVAMLQPILMMFGPIAMLSVVG